MFFLKTVAKQKDKLASKVKEEQVLRSSLPGLSRQILELAKTRDEITVKEIEDPTGANRNSIKVHVKKLAVNHHLVQVDKGRRRGIPRNRRSSPTCGHSFLPRGVTLVSCQMRPAATLFPEDQMAFLYPSSAVQFRAKLDHNLCQKPCQNLRR